MSDEKDKKEIKWKSIVNLRLDDKPGIFENVKQFLKEGKVPKEIEDNYQGLRKHGNNLHSAMMIGFIW